MREFETGATRNNSGDKLRYEGFISPRALHLYAQYMHEHRLQADGSLREPDNWQKGIPKEVYVDSFLRHSIDLWRMWRGETVVDPDTGEVVTWRELLCAICFNNQGLLHLDATEEIEAHAQDIEHTGTDRVSGEERGKSQTIGQGIRPGSGDPVADAEEKGDSVGESEGRSDPGGEAVASGGRPGRPREEGFHSTKF